ncbi:hypothetical protein SAMN05443252_10915 [Bacillus sp. OV322]|nr:hypothetical protein SAMN05443252_10915 [Bacillus sp. OV322]
MDFKKILLYLIGIATLITGFFIYRSTYTFIIGLILYFIVYFTVKSKPQRTDTHI